MIENKNQWRVDLKKSSDDFLKYVAPNIINYIGGGEIYKAEEAFSNKTGRVFDTFTGIDYFQKIKYGMRGLAVRIQYDFDYRTFSVRKSRLNGIETEYEKRNWTIQEEKRGFLYPFLTIQAYLKKHATENKKIFLSAGVIITKILYNYIEKKECTQYSNSYDKTIFITIPWNQIPCLIISPGSASSSLSLHMCF